MTMVGTVIHPASMWNHQRQAAVSAQTCSRGGKAKRTQVTPSPPHPGENQGGPDRTATTQSTHLRTSHRNHRMAKRKRERWCRKRKCSKEKDRGIAGEKMTEGQGIKSSIHRAGCALPDLQEAISVFPGNKCSEGCRVPVWGLQTRVQSATISFKQMVFT